MRSNTQKFLAVMFLLFQMGGASVFAQDNLEKKLDAVMRAILSKRTVLEVGLAATAGGLFINHMKTKEMNRIKALFELYEKDLKLSLSRVIRTPFTGQ